MKQFLLSIAFLGSIMVAGLAQTEEQNVLATFRENFDGVMVYDAQRVTNTYAENGVFIDPFGNIHAGRNTLLPFHQSLFKSWGSPKGETYKFENTTVRFLKPDVALVSLVLLVNRKNEAGKAEEQKSAWSAVFSKQNGKWLIEMAQITFLQQGN